MADILTEDGGTLITEGGDTLVTEDGSADARLIFRAREPKVLFTDGVQAGGAFTFESLIKDAGDTIPVKLEFGETEAVAFYWERDEQISLDEYKLPRTPNGYAMIAILAGTTGATEPALPNEVDGEVQDGSVRWKVVAKGTNGTATLSTPDCVVTPSGELTVTLVAINEGTAIVADYVGGEYGGDYEAKFTFLVNGKPRVARQTVKVRKL